MRPETVDRGRVGRGAAGLSEHEPKLEPTVMNSPSPRRSGSMFGRTEHSSGGHRFSVLGSAEGSPTSLRQVGRATSDQWAAERRIVAERQQNRRLERNRELESRTKSNYIAVMPPPLHGVEVPRDRSPPTRIFDGKFDDPGLSPVPRNPDDSVEAVDGNRRVGHQPMGRLFDISDALAKVLPLDGSASATAVALAFVVPQNNETSLLSLPLQREAREAASFQNLLVNSAGLTPRQRKKPAPKAFAGTGCVCQEIICVCDRSSAAEETQRLFDELVQKPARIAEPLASSARGTSSSLLRTDSAMAYNDGFYAGGFVSSAAQSQNLEDVEPDELDELKTRLQQQVKKTSEHTAAELATQQGDQLNHPITTTSSPRVGVTPYPPIRPLLSRVDSDNSVWHRSTFIPLHHYGATPIRTLSPVAAVDAAVLRRDGADSLRTATAPDALLTLEQLQQLQQLSRSNTHRQSSTITPRTHASSTSWGGTPPGREPAGDSLTHAELVDAPPQDHTLGIP